MKNVFVYGTLRKGNHAHRVLNEDFSSPDLEGKLGKTLNASYKMIAHRFPIVYEVNTKGSHILGELYSVTDSVVGSLDRYEGYPHFYGKELVEIELEDGSLEQAYMYIMSPENVADQRLDYSCVSIKPDENNCINYIPN